MQRFKFGRLLPDGEDVEHQYADVYDWERTTGPSRLIIAPRTGHVDLLGALAECWGGPYWLLYVLTVPRTGTSGRYQITEPVERPELTAFLARHRAFLEGDARHALWVAPATGQGTLVYDRHNVIYAYGPLEHFEDMLARRGVTRGATAYPVPHSHHYHAEFDDDEAELLTDYAWIHSPLRPGDED
jgi:hypothetical protein